MIFQFIESNAYSMLEKIIFIVNRFVLALLLTQDAREYFSENLIICKYYGERNFIDYCNSIRNFEVFGSERFDREKNFTTRTKRKKNERGKFTLSSIYNNLISTFILQQLYIYIYRSHKQKLLPYFKKLLTARKERREEGRKRNEEKKMNFHRDYVH